jgi:hypothetical protein
MDVVKTIERLGTSSGKPASQVRISDCGVTAAPAKAAVAPAAAAGSKRPADSGAANKSKKATVEDGASAAGIDNPEKNQKKIQLTSGLEYVDIKVHRAPPPSRRCCDAASQGWYRPSGLWREEDRRRLQRRAQGAIS